MAEEKKKLGLRRIGQILALLLFLVILPGGSWYYLRIGLNYRIEALQELGDHGRISSFFQTSYQGDTLRLEDLQGKLVVASFFNPDDQTLGPLFADNLRKLHQQFDNRADIVFLQHLLGNPMPSTDRIAAFATENGLSEENQCFFLTGGQPSTEQLARQGYRLPLDAGTPIGNSPYFALADTHSVIRRYYDVRKIEEIKRLVAHIAIILPREKTQDPVVRREPEK